MCKEDAVTVLAFLSNKMTKYLMVNLIPTLIFMKTITTFYILNSLKCYLNHDVFVHIIL